MSGSVPGSSLTLTKVLWRGSDRGVKARGIKRAEHGPQQLRLANGLREVGFHTELAAAGGIPLACFPKSA
jgi:hypothetical protein